MPLNTKGREILAAMKKQYGAKKGKSVFYASENSGKIKGVTGAADGATVHPGFENVAEDLAAKRKVPPESARAMLAKSTRGASRAAKKKNPRLKRVPGAADGATVEPSGHNLLAEAYDEFRN